MAVITVKREYTVKPEAPTWTGRLPLSELDQIPVYVVPTIYFYQPPEEWLAPSDKIVQKLRDSLGRALVPFHLLAARLGRVPGNRLELHCNAAGARLAEAESDATLEAYGDFSPSPEFVHLLPKLNHETPVEEMPLLHVQVTGFRCGGVSLGIMISHAVCDGRGAYNFMDEWTRIARGEAAGTQPFFDRAVLLRAREPPPGQPRFDFAQLEYGPPLLGDAGAKTPEGSRRKIANLMLELTNSQVDKLKNAANAGLRPDAVPASRPYSRFQALTSHVWRCMCKARGHVPEQPTRIAIAVDFRRRVNPPLPDGYLGNAVMPVVAEGRSGELIEGPLSNASGRIRAAIESVDDEYVWSAIDFKKSQPDPGMFPDTSADEAATRRPFHGNPNLRVTSWLTLPVLGKDFGWGKEKHMRLASHDIDGDTILLPGQLGNGSVVVGACIWEHHAGAFKKFFYEDIPSED